MAQPPTYNRQVSFTNIQALAPSDPLPGDDVDAELNAIKTTLDGILTNLALIQRDDGEIANQSVGLDQLAEDVEVGWEAPEVWVTSTAYTIGNTVFNGSAFYRCLVAHTSGVFATDLAADKWEEIVDLSDLTIVAADQIANTPAGSISAVTVQAAIDELASEKAAASHTHASSAISDSTSAGRDMLTAANVAAQRALLGLGALALEDTVPVTEIDAEIAFSGIIEPAALAADANDWSPTGIGTASVIRASASAAVTVTGLLAPAADGAIIFLQNVGTTYSITLANASASSAAANRFAIGRNIALRPGQGIVLMYDLDGSTPRWRSMQAFSELPRSYLSGCGVSNGTDTTNDLNIAAGVCRDSTDSYNIVCAAMTKQLDANWAAGTNQGMRYSGAAIANTTYHLYAVATADGTQDYYAHTSASEATALAALQAETGGSAYIFARRIFSFPRVSASIVQFSQLGDDVLLKTAVLDVNNTADHTTAANATLTVPVGIKVEAKLLAKIATSAAGEGVLVTSPDVTDAAPNASAAPGMNVITAPAWTPLPPIRTNTSAQVRYRASASTVDTLIVTQGWIDRRGRDD